MNNKKPDITDVHLIGAFGRHNFGDLLLAQIATAQVVSLLGAVAVHYYSPHGGDTSAYGGVKAHSYKRLLDIEFDNAQALLVCGGDVLAVDWCESLIHSTPAQFEPIVRALRRLVGARMANGSIRALLGVPFAGPYLIDTGLLKGSASRIGFLACGGSGLSNKGRRYASTEKAVKDYLQSTPIELTVRERSTQSSLQRIGIDCKLAPDPAFCLPFAAHPQVRGGKVFHQLGEYFVFQSADILSTLDIEAITSALSHISQSMNRSIALIPMAHASGHSDMTPLSAIHGKLSALGVRCGVFADLTIGEVIESIANACMCICTSLHATITAQVNLVPTVAIMCRKVPKLESHLSTWCHSIPASAVAGVNFTDSVFSLLGQAGDLRYQSEVDNIRRLALEDVRAKILGL
jgi:Polysaccharide pyruvyl transferase